MFGRIRNSIGMLRRAVLVATALVLSMGSVGITEPAQAAGLTRAYAKTVTTIILRFTRPQEPVCVNQTADFTVKTSADKDITLKGGKVEHVSEDPISGINVRAKSLNPDIATITPPSVLSGWDVDAEPAIAVFQITGKKAGTAILQFTATYAGRKTIEETSIRVEDCAYKVGMNVYDVDSREGVSIWIGGHVEIEIKGTGGPMEGNGELVLTSGFVGPPCSISYSQVSNAVTITGNVDDREQLDLDFRYSPGQLTSSVSCPGGGGGNSQTVDLTNIGLASLTFPAMGGTRSFSFTYAGSDMAPGRLTIDVEPVSEQAGG